MFCVNCGTKIEEGIKFCPGCGAQVGAAGVSINQEKAVNFIQPQPAVLPPAPQYQGAIMADERYCFSCGAVIKKAAVICPKCGVNQSMRSATTAVTVYCSSCGKTINKEAAICPFCGVSQGGAASGTGDKKGPAIAALVLGINSLWAFLFPFLGFPVSVVGVIMGIVGYKSSKRGMALAGIILSIIGFVATIINMAVGATLGATGQLF
jgi:RNA polymerase subunit RPABC4/transcription elongation factor Spt4